MCKIIPFKAQFKFDVSLYVKDILPEDKLYKIEEKIEEHVKHRQPYDLSDLNKDVVSEIIIEKSYLNNLFFIDGKILPNQQLEDKVKGMNFKFNNLRVDCRLTSKIYTVINTQKDFFTLDDKDDKGVFNFDLNSYNYSSDDFVLERLE